MANTAPFQSARADTRQPAQPVVVVTLYKFVTLTDVEDLQRNLLAFCKTRQLKGTILLATEGINGTVAGSHAAISELKQYLRDDGRLADLEFKASRHHVAPFYRMKVRIKQEIVTMGVPDINPARKNGRKVNAQEWNALLADPNVLVIDTRNHYEHEIGTFKNAVSPQTRSFSEFPEYVSRELSTMKDRKIAMFCTGGIRCEKSTAYLLEQGFEQVYHLDGGILKYLEQVAPEENHWQGDCFVFDNRVAVDSNLVQGDYSMCYGCRLPVSVQDKQSPQYEEGVYCPRCYAGLSEERKSALRERQFQVRLAERHNRQHIGITLENTKAEYGKLCN